MSFSIPNLKALFLDQLKDLYNVEDQLLNNMPVLVSAAANSTLRDELEAHLEQTHHQLQRLNLAMSSLGLSAKGKVCHAMEGLIKQAHETARLDSPAVVRDAALIGAVQQIEHYEIAAYGTARTFAEMLGQRQAADLLHATLEEEIQTDMTLTEISSSINAEALTATSGLQGNT